MTVCTVPDPWQHGMVSNRGKESEEVYVKEVALVLGSRLALTYSASNHTDMSWSSGCVSTLIS
jgi:hypothetical protein